LGDITFAIDVEANAVYVVVEVIGLDSGGILERCSTVPAVTLVW
jgi:hypothetical protein